MSGRFRLDLTVKTYPQGDRWTWTLWSRSRVVSTSGAQLFSRRIDCCRGAEVGANIWNVVDAVKRDQPFAFRPLPSEGATEDVAVRIVDERREPA